MLQEVLLPLAKSCRVIYKRPGDYHLLCFPSVASRSFHSVIDGDAFPRLSVSAFVFLSISAAAPARVPPTWTA